MTRIVLLRKYTVHVVYKDNRRSPQEYRFFTKQGKINKMRKLPVPWLVLVKGDYYTKVQVYEKFTPSTSSTLDRPT